MNFLLLFSYLSPNSPFWFLSPNSEFLPGKSACIKTQSSNRTQFSSPGMWWPLSPLQSVFGTQGDLSCNPLDPAGKSELEEWGWGAGLGNLAPEWEVSGWERTKEWATETGEKASVWCRVPLPFQRLQCLWSYWQCRKFMVSGFVFPLSFAY